MVIKGVVRLIILFQNLTTMVFLTSYQTFLFFSYRVLRLKMAIKKYILSKLVYREKRTYKTPG